MERLQTRSITEARREACRYFCLLLVCLPGRPTGFLLRLSATPGTVHQLQNDRSCMRLRLHVVSARENGSADARHGRTDPPFLLRAIGHWQQLSSERHRVARRDLKERLLSAIDGTARGAKASAKQRDEVRLPDLSCDRDGHHSSPRSTCAAHSIARPVVQSAVCVFARQMRRRRRWNS